MNKSERVFEVKVIPNSKKQRLSVDLFGKIKIWVTSPAEKGKANKSANELLSNHLGINPNSIELIKGFKSRNKLFKVSYD